VYTSESFRADDRKSLINMFCGSLGGQHTRKSRALVCENEEFSDATVVAEELVGNKCSVNFYPDQEDGGLYFLRTEKSTPKTFSSLPMHRQLIVSGWMALQVLVERFTAGNPGARLLSSNTDAATFALYPGSTLVDLDDLVSEGAVKGLAELGRPQYEKPHLHHKAMIQSCRREIPSAWAWNIVDEHDGVDSLALLQHYESLLITGAPGVGKSHLLGRFMKDHPAPDTVVGLCFTNVCVVGMRAAGVVNCLTLDSWFKTMQGPASKTKIATLSHASTIVIDECFAVHPAHWQLVYQSWDLARLEGQTPPNIIAFGNPDQTNPVQPGQKRRVYLECDFLKRLCFGNHLNMCYKKESLRYDAPLHAVIQHLKATGYLLPRLCQDKKWDNSLTRNLSYFNDNGTTTSQQKILRNIVRSSPAVVVTVLGWVGRL
jgi:hypothetical protein